MSKLAEWFERFAGALQRREAAEAAAMFREEAYWRDIVAFTWNIKTCESRGKIEAMLATMPGSVAPSNWRIGSASAAPDGLIDAWLRFETAAGRGRAILRLRGGKALTPLTTLDELKGFEARRGGTPPPGLEHCVYGDRPVWSEARAAEQTSLGRDVQPYCVIVGDGQGGVTLGARFKQLGVPTIILETNAC
jgi:putative flavoprotein involved in K+ transport